VLRNKVWLGWKTLLQSNFIKLQNCCNSICNPNRCIKTIVSHALLYQAEVMDMKKKFLNPPLAHFTFAKPAEIKKRRKQMSTKAAMTNLRHSMCIKISRNVYWCSTGVRSLHLFTETTGNRHWQETARSLVYCWNRGFPLYISLQPYHQDAKALKIFICLHMKLIVHFFHNDKALCYLLD